MLDDYRKYRNRSVPENNAMEYAIPFRAILWNNANQTRLISLQIQIDYCPHIIA